MSSAPVSAGTYMMTIVSLAVGVCAVMAYMGFRGRVTTVGIDLGTTFSVVGLHRNGKVEIVKDKTSGKMIFPSIVHYASNGEVHVGYEALPYLSTDPKNTIFNAKRFIGRSLEDQDVVEYAKSHPFDVIDLNTATENAGGIGNISMYSQVGFKITASGHPAVISPEQVGTEVLKHLLKHTAAYLKHNRVNKAVIAVPAKFTSAQRAATGAAYKAAGLKVVRVLEEPTAAAVAYDLHKKQNIHHILVYDFGGGTLDVSILYVAKGSVQVYATDGDSSLGGSDFDMSLYAYIKRRIYEESGGKVSLDYSSSNYHRGKDADGSAIPCLASNIREEAESIKKKLTTKEAVQFQCTDENDDSQNIVSFTVTREDFERSCDHLFKRSLLPIHRLLDDLEMSVHDIDEIVLVGGSTRMPLIKKALKAFFGKSLNDEIDPDITVSYGASSVLT